MFIILLIILGVIIGVICLGIFQILAFFVLKEVLVKNVKTIKTKIEKEIRRFEDATEDKSSIIYPNQSKDIFLNENSTINDILDK